MNTEMEAEFLDRTMTTMLKAIAILMVITAHLLPREWVDEYTANLLGTGGVAIFLVLSGYGLYMSYVKKGISVDFWKNKYHKVYVPYVITTLIYVVVFANHLTVNVLCKNLLLIDYKRNIDGTMWYLSFLIIWYIAFFVLFCCPIPSLIRVFLLFGLAYWFQAYAANYFAGCAWQFVTNAVAFPTGVFIAWLANVILNSKYKRIFLKCMPVISAVALGVYCWGAMWREVSFGVLGILLFVFTGGIVKLLSKIGILAKILNIVGVNSLLLYLVEGKVITCLSRIESVKQNRGLLVIFFILLCTVICMAWNKVVVKRNRKQKVT